LCQIFTFVKPEKYDFDTYKGFFEEMAPIHWISTNFVVEKMSFESFKISGNNIINVKGHQGTMVTNMQPM
jgi:hypothetical protein